MPKFIFLLHTDSGAGPIVQAEVLEHDVAAQVFGRDLLGRRPEMTEVEVMLDDVRITTIKQVGSGKSASTQVHAPRRETRYRLTVVDRINQAEPSRVIYLQGRTRPAAMRRATLAIYQSEIIVDLVPLD